MKQGTKENIALIGMVVGIICVILTPIVAWFTHVITCIQTEAWGFLVAGAIFFPVGIVHGIGIWFGAW